MAWRDLLDAYAQLMEAYPCMTQAISTGVLSASGDITSQYLIETRCSSGNQGLDLLRTLRFAAIGMLYVAPFFAAWYNVMDQYYGPPGDLMNAAKKMMTTQMLIVPPFMIVFLYLVELTGNGFDHESAKRYVVEKFPEIFVAGCCFWPLVQVVMFHCIPLDYQIVFGQVVSLVWNTFLAWRMNADKGP